MNGISGQIVHLVIFIFHEPLSSVAYIIPCMGFLEFHDAFLSFLIAPHPKQKPQLEVTVTNEQKRIVTALETPGFLSRDQILEQKKKNPKILKIYLTL